MSYDYQQQPAYPQQPQQAPYGQPPQYPQQWQQAPYAGQQPQPVQYAPQAAPPRRAVTRQRRRTSHGLHLVLTVCTFGLWGLCVWLPLTAWHKFGPKQKIVTTYR